jgi:cytochrome c553
MPPVLASSGDPRKPACGYCHLPSGGGRPENANLAGLPAAYILAQVHAFHAHERGVGVPDAVAADAAAPVWPPSAFMARVSADVSDADLAAAAGYFAQQRPTSRVTVIEGRTVPGFAPACFVYLATGGRRVALGWRIVEMPTEVRRFELRDPHATVQAYVPPGSIGRGRQLASDGGGGRTQPCAGCHGVDLKGGGSLPGPPLAGRFTGYLFRQLYAFKSGARQGDAARPMRAVAAGLTQRDMIDLAAYATSIPP